MSFYKLVQVSTIPELAQQFIDNGHGEDINVYVLAENYGHDDWIVSTLNGVWENEECVAYWTGGNAMKGFEVLCIPVLTDGDGVNWVRQGEVDQWLSD